MTVVALYVIFAVGLPALVVIPMAISVHRDVVRARETPAAGDIRMTGMDDLDVSEVICPWQKTFIIWPRKSPNGRIIWGTCYKRSVFRYFPDPENDTSVSTQEHVHYASQLDLMLLAVQGDNSNQNSM